MTDYPQLNRTRAIASVDGRYWPQVWKVSDYFSNFALNKNRVAIEIEYLISFHAFINEPLPYSIRTELRRIYDDFSEKDSDRLEEFEKQTDHDVKAIEYLIKEKTGDMLTDAQRERIHLGLTSEDPTNLSYSISWNEAKSELYTLTLEKLGSKITKMADDYRAIPMLARTHGKAASPTTIGKELANFGYRLEEGKKAVSAVKIRGKLNGAVGNYNALVAAYPEKDWIKFTVDFVSDLSLKPCLLTTQILPHDDISRLMREIVGVNQVVLDLNQDMWRYISDDWFVQQVIAGQVGSSTMPQKVNPRFFENSEGNLKKAKALFEEMADDLQVSRLQRDLSGSTIQRDYGLPLAWTILGYEMAMTNLNRLSPNAEKISSALDEHPEIISEAIQTILRREGVPGAYEKMRDFVRGKEVTLDDLHTFVKSLNLSDDVEKEILSITPQNYLGNSIKLTEMFVDKKI